MYWYCCSCGGFTVHHGDEHQHSGVNAKSRSPLSLKRLADDVGEEERENGGVGVWKRETAEPDQYSNCKMNLTGARTSHQMGKEIGYEQ